MKIAIVSFLVDPHLGGGAATSAVRIADGLMSRGHEVIIITTGPDKGLVEDLESGRRTYRFRPANLYWIGDKERQPLAKRALWQVVDIWNPHVFLTVRRLLVKERPDVVHVQKLRGLSPAVWSAAFAANVNAIVHTCRDYELMSPEGTLSGVLGSWARRGTWPIVPYQYVRRRASRHVNVVTAPSRYTLDLHVNSGFFRSSKKMVIPNSHGVSLIGLRARREEWLRRHAALDDHDRGLRILYIGRIESSKGVEDLFEAFTTCANIHPDLQLELAGWGSLEAELQKQYGGRPGVHFHGAVFGDKKERIIDSADVVIVPSRWPEVFGNVIVEAFARGKPVIATRAGGMPELIEPGKTGFLVSEANVPELAAAISWCATNREALRSMAMACFDAAERFTLDRVTDMYEEAYFTALERPGRSE